MGTIRLEVVHHGRRVEFRCRDDGRGVDPDKVRAAIVARGRLTQKQAAALSTEEVFSLLFETGLSTADRVTEISGRGVGLDVVRVVANRFRGQATIHSELGRGTEVTIENASRSHSAWCGQTYSPRARICGDSTDAFCTTANMNHRNEICAGESDEMRN